MKEKLAQYRALIESETDVIAVMANTSAFIMEHISGLNWAGFYQMKGDELVLGPFQGRPACYRKSIMVPDVHAFPGHIACDAASKSELVVPIIHNGILFGVIDLDAPEYDHFTDTDKHFIEAIVEIFSQKL